MDETAMIRALQHLERQGKVCTMRGLHVVSVTVSGGSNSLTASASLYQILLSPKGGAVQSVVT